jgi:hypothetical protein
LRILASAASSQKKEFDTRTVLRYTRIKEDNMERIIERWLPVEDFDKTVIDSGWEIICIEDGMILLIKECV